MDSNFKKTYSNNFNQNSGLVVYVNSKHKTKQLSEIFINKCNCLQLNISANGNTRVIVALYRGNNNIFSEFKSQITKLLLNVTTVK